MKFRVSMSPGRLVCTCPRLVLQAGSQQRWIAEACVCLSVNQMQFSQHRCVMQVLGCPSAVSEQLCDDLNVSSAGEHGIYFGVILSVRKCMMMMTSVAWVVVAV